MLAAGRLPEGVAGIGQLHELIGRFLPAGGDAEVQVGIETDRGPMVGALIAAGYVVFAVNPLQASRYGPARRVRAKSDGGDAHMLADAVRTDAHQLRPAAGDSPAAEAVKVLARTHDADLAAVRGCAAAAGPAAGVLPGRGGGVRRPGRAGRAGAAGQGAGPGPRGEADPRPGLGGPQAAGRRKITQRTDAILAALRSPQLARPPALTAAYAATVRSLTAVVAALNEQVASLQGQVEAHFGQHLDAEIYLSQPRPGRDYRRPGARRVRRRPAPLRLRQEPQELRGTSPITRASGKKKIVQARYVRNDRLIDALMLQAFAALVITRCPRLL